MEKILIVILEACDFKSCEVHRLKYNETYQERIEWSVRRSLSKTNYRIHTDSIKENIVPTLTDKQKVFVYLLKLELNSL